MMAVTVVATVADGPAALAEAVEEERVDTKEADGAAVTPAAAKAGVGELVEMLVAAAPEAVARVARAVLEAVA